MKKMGLVLLPHRKASLEAIRLSQQIAGNRLALSLESTLPHVTVLQSYFSPTFRAREALHFARAHRGFTGEPYSRFNGISSEATDEIPHIFWWRIVNAEWLSSLNREFIERYEGFIVKPPAHRSPKLLSAAAQESFERTGYSRNLRAYEPHITVGVTESNAEVQLDSPMSGELVRFHRLALVEHGELGEITRIIESVELPVSWD